MVVMESKTTDERLGMELMSARLGALTASLSAAVALALAGARILRSLLHGVGALDPVTFVRVPVLLLAVTLLAAYVPARRASRVDSVKALKAE